MRQSNWHEFMEINLNALGLMNKKKELSHEIMNMKTEIFALDLRGRVFFIPFISCQARQV